MRPRILFVAGVHGIGKTSLCRSVSAEFHVGHHSASKLIAEQRQIQFPSDRRVPDISQNQDALISAIDKNLDRDSKYLLDGHFCLLNPHGVITEIPLTTFAAMSPIGIILLYDDPNSIYSHLQDIGRDMYHLELLTSLQKRELDYSRFVATKLNIPYLQARPSADREKIDRFVADKLK